MAACGLAALMGLTACDPDATSVPSTPDAAATPDVSDGAHDGSYAEAPLLRRLTRGEFEYALRHVLGPVAVEPTDPDLYTAGFARVGATDITTSATGVERYSFAVESALDSVFADPARRDVLLACELGPADSPACVEHVIRKAGQRAWRRPMTANQVARYVALHAECAAAVEGASEAPALGGYRCVLSGLLTSPYFLYRVELPDSDGVYRGYAMASRLAFLLWSQPPDGALLAAAHAGALDTAEGVRAEAERMLADPKARQGLHAFVDEWFRTDRLERLERDMLAQTDENAQFALGSAGVLQPWLQWMVFAAKEELRRLVAHHVLDEDRDYVDLLITDRTFVDGELDAFYELPVDDEEGQAAGLLTGATGPSEQVIADGTPGAQGFYRAHHAADSPRRGILGTVAVLAQLGKQDETSPTRRGFYLLEKVLCLHVGEPPDNIDMCPRVDGVSRRESMEAHHMCAPACTGCHAQMDPLGFAFDSFDTIGRWRTHDDWGFELDTQVTWKLNRADGTSVDLPFDSLRSAAETFYGLDETTECVTRQVYRYATGLDEHAQDPEVLNGLNAAFVSGGRRLKGFLVHLVGSDAFRRAPAGLPTETGAPTLERVMADVFTPHCGACHQGLQLGGLDLRPGEDLMTRLTSPSLGVPAMPLVTPGDLGQSYLWHKLVGTHLDVGGAGDPMPANAPLEAEALDLVRRWIEGTP